MTDTATTPEVTIVPANEASWEDLQAVLGMRGDPSVPVPAIQDAVQGVLGLGRRRGACLPVAPADRLWAPGVQDDEWPCRVPRRRGRRLVRGRAAHAHPRLLRNTRVPWEGRAEDKTDHSVGP